MRRLLCAGSKIGGGGGKVSALSRLRATRVAKSLRSRSRKPQSRAAASASGKYRRNRSCGPCVSVICSSKPRGLSYMAVLLGWRPPRPAGAIKHRGTLGSRHAKRTFLVPASVASGRCAGGGAARRRDSPDDCGEGGGVVARLRTVAFSGTVEAQVSV